MDIKSIWKDTRHNVKTRDKGRPDICELNQRKEWLDEARPEMFGKIKQAKLLWLQNSRQVNKDNMDNERREARKTYRAKIGIHEIQN